VTPILTDIVGSVLLLPFHSNMRPPGPREKLAGPDSGPESPFPIRLSGPIIKGFGRGSREV
jgi:hypothetical protein